MKLFKKKEKENLKNQILEAIKDLDKAILECDPKDRKDLKEAKSKLLEQLAKLESSRWEGWAKIAAAALAVIGAVLPTVLTIRNYNKQYRLEKSLDETQIGMERSRFSPSNNIRR